MSNLKVKLEEVKSLLSLVFIKERIKEINQKGSGGFKINQSELNSEQIMTLAKVAQIEDGLFFVSVSRSGTGVVVIIG